jgi:Cu-Zn family superoxide dismutase
MALLFRRSDKTREGERMPSARHAALGILGLALAGCATLEQLPTERVGSATLRLASGQPAGTAQLLGIGSTLNISIALAGLTPGTHGVHLHATGSCEAPDFQSAGGHLNPDSRAHGSENPQGAHLGDLPNVMIGANGAGTVSATLHGTRAEALAAIFDADGTAVVVHAGADDYRTDPSGNSGGRVACGVFTRS